MRTFALLVLLLLPLTMWPQGSRITRLTGELVDDDANTVTIWGSVTVELDNQSGGMAFVDRAVVNPGGGFEFHDVETGQYRIRVLDSRKETVLEQFVSVQQGVPLTIRIPHPPAASPSTGTVAARALRVPARAVKEFVRSDKAFRAGDTQKSVEYLKRAVRAYPDFLEAQTNLGARYIQLRQFAQAESPLRRAVAIDPNCTIALSNLALCLMALHQYEEAERYAKHAAELDPSSSAVQAVLLATRVRQGR